MSIACRYNNKTKEYWMSNVPANWSIVRLKDIATLYSGLTGKSGDDFRCEDESVTKPYIPFTNILNNTAIDFNQFSRVVMADSEQQNVVKDGDLLFLMSSEDYDSIAKCATVIGDPGEVYLNSFCRGLRFDVSERKNINPKFIAYELAAAEYRDALRFEARGFTRINIKVDKIASMSICLPPKIEQDKIVKYLDTKMAEIESQVSLLSSKRDKYTRIKNRVIDTAITQGLNSSSTKRDSGILWIGLIPSHWTLTRVKETISVKGRIGWQGLRSDEFEDNSYAYLVTGQDFISSDINWRKCYQINKTRYDEDPYIQLKNGDILVTKDGTIGKVAKVTGLDKPASLNSGIFVLRQINKNSFDQGFLFWQLKSSVFKKFNDVTKTGATIAHLYQNVFVRMPILQPPIGEQQAIADYLDDKCAKIDSAIEIIDKQIAKYTELKKSLINEVITGKRVI